MEGTGRLFENHIVAGLTQSLQNLFHLPLFGLFPGPDVLTQTENICLLLYLNARRGVGGYTFLWEETLK